MKHKFVSKRYWNSQGTPMGDSANALQKYDDIINFTLGDPDFTTPKEIIKAAMEDALAGHTHYTNFYGDPQLREAIAQMYKEDYDFTLKKEEVLITTSGCHAMWLVLEAILDDGDEVIVHEPFFTPYQGQIKLARGIPVFLPTKAEENFEINVADLEKCITNRTKALILNTPNNPTGTCFSRPTMEAIAKIAVQYDLIVIADDIYTEFSFQEPFLPMMTLPGMKERTITISSFSKNYAMTGWRIGYMAAPEYLIHTMKDINENNVFTAPSISQRAALYAIKHRKELCPPLVKEIQDRLNYAYERIVAIPKISTLPVKGSMYLFIDITKTGLSSSEFCQILLDEAHIMAIAGNAFGESGEGYIRIALTIPVPRLKEAFDRMEKISVLQK